VTIVGIPDQPVKINLIGGTRQIVT